MKPKSILKIKTKKYKKKHVSFAKPIKSVRIIKRQNKGEPVNPVIMSSIKDDIKLPHNNFITQIDIQKNIVKFFKKLDLCFIESTIVYDKILYINSVLEKLKNCSKLTIVPFKHNNIRDLIVINPNYKSIEWLSCKDNPNKDLFKKLKQLFRSNGYHLIKPTILPNPCSEFMLFYVDFKSRHPTLSYQKFHSQFNKINFLLIQKQILYINFKLTSNDKRSFQSKISKLDKMNSNDITKLYQKLLV